MKKHSANNAPLAEPKCSFIHWDIQERLEKRVCETQDLLSSVRATLKTSEAIVMATKNQVDSSAKQAEPADS